MSADRALVLTCEHGGARIPARYRPLFAGAARALASHRGSDAGSLQLARQFARRFSAPLVATTVSRLLVDTNRSPRHPKLFSEWSAGLTEGERSDVFRRYWEPFRSEALAALEHGIQRSGGVVHLSIHSFTPVFEGRRRDVDIGFLYDPARAEERAFARAWKAALAALRPDLRLASNRPYRGTADGHTTALRHRLGPRYSGIELEVSQARTRGPGWPRLRRELGDALGDARPAGAC